MTQPERDRQGSGQEQRERRSETAGNNQGQQDAYEQSGLSEYGRSEGAGGSGQALGESAAADTRQSAAADSGQSATPDKGQARRGQRDASGQTNQGQQDAHEQSGLSEYGRSEGAGGSGQPLGQGAADDKSQARRE